GGANAASITARAAAMSAAPRVASPTVRIGRVDHWFVHSVRPLDGSTRLTTRSTITTRGSVGGSGFHRRRSMNSTAPSRCARFAMPAAAAALAGGRPSVARAPTSPRPPPEPPDARWSRAPQARPGGTGGGRGGQGSPPGGGPPPRGRRAAVWVGGGERGSGAGGGGGGRPGGGGAPPRHEHDDAPDSPCAYHGACSDRPDPRSRRSS